MLGDLQRLALIKLREKGPWTWEWPTWRVGRNRGETCKVLDRLVELGYVEKTMIEIPYGDHNVSREGYRILRDAVIPPKQPWGKLECPRSVVARLTYVSRKLRNTDGVSWARLGNAVDRPYRADLDVFEIAAREHWGLAAPGDEGHREGVVDPSRLL